jgi:hypothetical protein
MWIGIGTWMWKGTVVRVIGPHRCHFGFVVDLEVSLIEKGKHTFERPRPALTTSQQRMCHETRGFAETCDEQKVGRGIDGSIVVDGKNY